MERVAKTAAPLNKGGAVAMGEMGWPRCAKPIRCALAWQQWSQASSGVVDQNILWKDQLKLWTGWKPAGTPLGAGLGPDGHTKSVDAVEHQPTPHAPRLAGSRTAVPAASHRQVAYSDTWPFRSQGASVITHVSFPGLASGSGLASAHRVCARMPPVPAVEVASPPSTSAPSIRSPAGYLWGASIGGMRDRCRGVCSTSTRVESLRGPIEG
jgi:hypothetical protein